MSAVVVDLPFVPVIAMNGQSGACARRSRTKSSMSPRTGTSAAAREIDRPVRLRMGQRHARRQDEGCKRPPVDVAEVGGGDPLRPGRRDAIRIVVVRHEIGAAGHQRAGGGEPGPAEPEKGDAPALEGGDRDHRRYRIFSVARPSMASMTAMIQNRTTTWLSVQPFFSKW